MEQNWHHPAVAPFPSVAHRDKCSSKQSSLFLSLTPGWWINCSKQNFSFLFLSISQSVYTEAVCMSVSISEHPHVQNATILSILSVLCGAPAWCLVTMLWCQVLPVWKLYNRHSKSKAALWERIDISGWNKEQDSCVCHKRCERFGVSHENWCSYSMSSAH